MKNMIINLNTKWMKAWTFIIPAVVSFISWMIILLEHVVEIGEKLPPELLGEKGLIIFAIFSSLLAVLRLIPQKNMSKDE